MAVSGVIAGCLTGLSVALLVAGTVAGLVLAEVPPGVIIAVGLGLPGLPLAGLALREYLRFRGHFRSRRQFRSRPLTGWRLTAAALASAALGTGSAVAGFRGSATGSAVLAVLALSLAVRCAVAARIERAVPACSCLRCVGWTEADREWLEETGAALPEAGERR